MNQKRYSIGQGWRVDHQHVSETCMTKLKKKKLTDENPVCESLNPRKNGNESE